MNLALRRPSMRRLEYWLDHKPERFERYLAAHPEIADRFEEANPLRDRLPAFREALDAAVTAPLDLAARLRDRLLEERTETSALAVLLDLGGVGPATLALLAGPVVDDED
jgi:hypothetical protein